MANLEFNKQLLLPPPTNDDLAQFGDQEVTILIDYSNNGN